jgi:hypothetical protein
MAVFQERVRLWEAAREEGAGPAATATMELRAMVKMVVMAAGL